ncbi:efflux RND transporter periplasmic adaptor subunit [Nitrincola schmidtii]|uniref:efflux RND transporter periplasmic adaptor subunit n=1 Tax=Nitrincola schmidtii TaxID=1730894 RepID=UPI00124C4E50|nr:HlyD family efflux transporter periplasmic adaptor subunit [Nitrincola schmidtii]
MRHKLKYLIPPALIIFAVLIFMLLKATRPEAPPVEEEQRRWPVAALNIQIEELSPTIRLFGQINTEALTSIRARSAGDIDQVMVQSGDSVDQGELLIQIDPLDAQAERDLKFAEREDLLAQKSQRLAQFESDKRSLTQDRELVTLAERQLERNRQLAQSNRVSTRDVEIAEQALRQQRLTLFQKELAVEQHPSRLQQLEASLKRVESQLQIAERNLAATQLTAPEAGRVVEVMVAQGDRVSANTVMATLVVPSRIELMATLPLRYVAKARSLLADNTPITVEALVDGVSYQFELDRFAAQTDRSASMTGYFRLTSGDATQLPLGRFIEARMSLPTLEPSIWIPTSALYGRDRIYQIDNERLHAITVNLLGEYEQQGRPGFLVQTDQLKDGDQVLANRLPQAVEGLAVEVIDEYSAGSDL